MEKKLELLSKQINFMQKKKNVDENTHEIQLIFPRKNCFTKNKNYHS